MPLPVSLPLRRILPWLPLLDLADALSYPEATNRYVFNPAHWLFYGDCGPIRAGPGSFAEFSGTQFLPAWNCLGGQAKAPNLPPVGLPFIIPTGHPFIWTVIHGQDYAEVSPGNWRGTNRKWWHASGGFQQAGRVTPYINRIPAEALEIVPNPIHSINPDTLPLRGWAEAAPVPWRALPRLIPSPFPQATQRGNQAPGTPNLAPAPAEVPWPSVVIEPGFRPQPRTETPSPPRRKPPEKGEKEKKLKMPRGAAMALIGAVTEGADLVGALWDAIPDKQRTRGATLWQRMQDVYRNFEDIEVFEALGNIGWEMAQDMFIARFAPRGGLPGTSGRGLAQGPWDQGGRFHDPETDAQRERRERAQHFRWLASLPPERRALERRAERDRRRLQQSRKRGGGNRANAGPLRRVKLRDGRSAYTSR